MARFTEIIQKLRVARLEQLEKAKKKRATRKTSKKKAPKKIKFDNPELQALFDKMPNDCKDLIRKGK